MVQRRVAPQAEGLMGIDLNCDLGEATGPGAITFSRMPSATHGSVTAARRHQRVTASLAPA